MFPYAPLPVKTPPVVTQPVGAPLSGSANKAVIQWATPGDKVISSNGAVTYTGAQSHVVNGSVTQTLHNLASTVSVGQFDRFYSNISGMSSLYNSMKQAYQSGNVKLFDGLSVSASESMGHMVSKDAGGEYSFIIGDQYIPFSVFQGAQHEMNDEKQSTKTPTEQAMETNENINKSHNLTHDFDWIKKEFSGKVQVSNLPKSLIDYAGGKALIQSSWKALTTSTSSGVGEGILQSQVLSNGIRSGVGEIFGAGAGEAAAYEIGAEGLLEVGAATFGVEAASVVGAVTATGGLLVGAALLAAAGYGLYKFLGGTRSLDLPDMGKAAESLGSLFIP